MPASETAALLARLVSFDTTSRNSNLELIAFVEEYLAGFGIRSERVTDETGAKANLWATIGPSDVPGVILSGHTDVVPVDGQDWTRPPFVLEEEDGLLYGRGTTDMKGFLAAVLAAVPAMVARPLARPVHIAFSYDEEIGCVGVQTLLAALKDRPVRPAFCIVGEPTSMEVVTGHKAKRSMRVTLRGRSCHSSLAPQGVNAVDYAALLVVRIREIAQRLAGEGARDEAYDVPFSTAHTGVIHGGTALNIVPDRCTLDCEFRVLPGEDADRLVDELRAYAEDELVPEMRRVAPEAGIEIEMLSAFPGLDTDADAEVTRLARDLSRRNGQTKVAYGTEAGLFVERLGVPTIVIGPGSIAQAHKPDEFIARSELDSCDRFLERLVDWAAARA